MNLEEDGTGMGVKFVEFDGDGEAQLAAYLEQTSKTV
jgi:hypothetical protein